MATLNDEFDSAEIVNNAVELLNAVNSDTDALIPQSQLRHTEAQSQLLTVIAVELQRIRVALESRP